MPKIVDKPTTTVIVEIPKATHLDISYKGLSYGLSKDATYKAVFEFTANNPDFVNYLYEMGNKGKPQILLP